MERMASLTSEEIQLRPTKLAEIIGQEEVKRQLQISIDAALARKEALGHLLIAGRPGLGKTTLAQAVAFELNRPIIYADGPSLTKDGIKQLIARELSPSETFAELYKEMGMSAKEGGVLLSDEIHAIPAASHEMMYTLMEDFKYEGREVEPFTFIGATTDPGKLPMAFRSRFIVQVTIDYYDVDSLWHLLRRSYLALQGEEPAGSTEDALKVIAERSRGTPRLANNLLRRVRDVQFFRKADEITEEVLTEAMKMMGIDRFGLDEGDRKFLVSLEALGRPSGTAAIAMQMGSAKESVEEIHEPWLVRQGFVIRTQRGRALTEDGHGLVKLLEKIREEGNEEEILFS